MSSPIPRSTMIESIDADALVACVAAAVVALMIPELGRSTAPMLVDRDEMARLASVSPQMIDKLRSAGTIPSVMAGRRRLYRPDAVIDALASTNEKGGAAHE